MLVTGLASLQSGAGLAAQVAAVAGGSALFLSGLSKIRHKAMTTYHQRHGSRHNPSLQQRVEESGFPETLIKSLLVIGGALWTLALIAFVVWLIA